MTRYRSSLSRTAALAGLLLAATVVGSCCAEPEPRRFQILQLNDLYRIEGVADGTQGGLARVRTLREQLEANRELGPVLVLHAGDMLYPSVMSDFLSPEPMIDVLNRLDGNPLGRDPLFVATFGNHEFDPKRPHPLRRAIAASEFDWVSSNVYLRGVDGYFSAAHEQFDNVHRVLVRQIGGVKVGILGITIAGTDPGYVLYDSKKFSAEDPPYSEAVRAAIAELRSAGAELIIALTHLEMADDVRLAERFQGIDLVIGGHDHISQDEQVGRTWITKADADAVTVRVLEVDLRQSSPRVYQRRQSLAGVAKDREVEERVAYWVDKLNAEGRKRDAMWDRTWVPLTEPLDGEETAIRTRATSLGSWLADVMREQTGADVALVQGGSIRINDSVRHELQGRHLAGIFYFDGKVVTTCMTREALCTTLRNGVSQVEQGAGRFLQVSGLSLEYDPDLPDDPEKQAGEDDPCLEGKAVQGVVRRDGAARPIVSCPGRDDLKVATLEYTWKNRGNEGFDSFDPGSSFEHGSWREMTEGWLREHGKTPLRVLPPPQNRIRQGEGLRVILGPDGGAGASDPQAPTSPPPAGTERGGGAVDTG